LFVDSSAWYPLARTSHADHARLATALTARVGRKVRIVTTNLVVAESHALILARSDPNTARRFLREVRSPPIEIVVSDAALESRAVTHWIEKFRDQPFSMTDAVSFEVMKSRGIREALTLDGHFAVAGFTMVPSPA
jgi:predicted nucleic acid-binding protein